RQFLDQTLGQDGHSAGAAVVIYKVEQLLFILLQLCKTRLLSVRGTLLDVVGESIIELLQDRLGIPNETQVNRKHPTSMARLDIHLNQCLPPWIDQIGALCNGIRRGEATADHEDHVRL